MANDTATDVEKKEQNSHEDKAKANLWQGGRSPFKSSYGKLMMWYFLLSDAFTFAGFLIAYGALRFSMDAWPVPDHVFSTAPFGLENSPLIFVTFMTFVLIVSSVTVLRAVQEGKLENQNGVVKWLVVTIFGGAVFLGCQAWEWTKLIAGEGTTIYENPFSSHVDEGKYLSFEEMATLNKEKNLGYEQKMMTFDIHYDNGDVKAEPFPYLALPNTNYKNSVSTPKEPKYLDKLYPKIDHHFFHRHETSEAGKFYATNKDKVTFKVGDPYLIAYHDGKYYPGTYERGGKLVAEAEGPKSFGTLFFFITGFHGFHVFSGLIILSVIAINSWSGFYGSRKNGYEMVEKVGLYWHFVDLVWVFVFLVFYLI